MPQYQTHGVWKVDDLSPDFVMFVKRPGTEEAVDLTGTTEHKVYLRNMETDTLLIDGNANGTTMVDAETGELKHEWQVGETAIRRELCRGWFSYMRGTKPETTTSVEISILYPWETSEG